MTSFDVTRRALSFGAQDPTTGQYALVYTNSTIVGSVQPQGSSMAMLPVGSYAKYPNTFFTEYVVHEGDQIVDADLDVYELNTVTKWSIGDKFSHYACEAVKQPFNLRDPTSGTWHLDSDSLTTDPRSRNKIYLDTYLTGISGDYITCFEGADYPIKYLFRADLGVDAVICIGEEGTVQEDTIYDVPYKDIVTVPITIYAVNKTGHTATNLIEQIEKAIEEITTAHPIGSGSKRSVTSSKPTRTELGDKSYLWQKTVTIKYQRANDEHVPTLPTLTWGAAAGTFIFPNVIAKQERYVNNDVYMDIPGRLGSYPQALGSKSLEIELTCDLDMEHTNLTWKRAQTVAVGSKTDASNLQVFQDIIHEGADSEAYQTLTLEWGSFKVRLTDMQLGQDGNQKHVTLTFKEYNDSAANTAYKTRWGIT